MAPSSTVANNDDRGTTEKITTETASKKEEATADDTRSRSPAKKKKKKGYKNLMAGMLEGTSATRDIDKEKEKQIKKVTGGGAFQKIDKI